MGSHNSFVDYTLQYPQNIRNQHPERNWSCLSPDVRICPPCGNFALYNQTIGETYPFWLGEPTCKSKEGILDIFNPNVKGELEWYETAMDYYHFRLMKAHETLLVFQSEYAQNNDTTQHNPKLDDKILRATQDYVKATKKMETARVRRDHVMTQCLQLVTPWWVPSFDSTRLKQMTTKEDQARLHSLGVINMTWDGRNVFAPDYSAAAVYEASLEPNITWDAARLKKNSAKDESTLHSLGVDVVWDKGPAADRKPIPAIWNATRLRESWTAPGGQKGLHKLGVDVEWKSSKYKSSNDSALWDDPCLTINRTAKAVKSTASLWSA